MKFDSKDWNSIKKMIKEVNKKGTMLSGKTEEGEDITFSVSKSDPESDEYDVLCTTVSQKNGYIRTNYYYPKDYTIEELYRKE